MGPGDPTKFFHLLAVIFYSPQFSFSIILFNNLFAKGAIIIDTGKAIQTPTPKAFNHRFMNPLSIPEIIHVRKKDIKNPIAIDIMDAKM